MAIIASACTSARVPSLTAAVELVKHHRMKQQMSRRGFVKSSLLASAAVPLGLSRPTRSTANDLLKYVSANLGLTPSNLTQLMEETHAVHFHESADADIGLAWEISHDQKGAKIVWKTGGTAGCRTFVGLNKARRRGVVVLSNSQDFDLVYNLGNFLLESEWQSLRRPALQPAFHP